MIRNYFIIAFRNLWRNKGFSILNIAGLSIGIAASVLILLWIVSELEVDKFHENKDRIYEVYNQYEVDGDMWTWNTVPKPMAAAIKEEYPEVKYATRVDDENSFLFSKGEKRVKATGNIVDSTFLNVFSFPLLKGDPNTVFDEVNSVVITEALAEKLFKNENPIGQIVKVDNADNFTVRGVLKKLPANTAFDFEFLIPWSYMRQKDWDDDNWGNNSVNTYVLLNKGATLNAIAPKIKVLRQKYDQDSPKMTTMLYPYTRSYLYSKFENGVEVGGRIDIIRMFGIIAIFILVIACINFMNLSTARSERRAKEVGIRKVVGAQKKSLVLQFLGESVLISFIASLFALLIIWISLPFFNDLVKKQLALDLSSSWFWITGIGIILITGILAGSYPAIYLSSFKPVAVLKGKFKKVTALVTPRKVLVVLQFTFAIMLIIATVVVRQQLRNAQDRQLGYSKNHLVYYLMEGDAEKNYKLIKQELLSSGAAVSVTKTSAPITEAWSNSWGFQWQGKPDGNKTVIDRFCADDAIAKTAGFELLEGRDIDLKNYPTDSTAALINESALKLMQFKEPIGQIIKDNGIDWHVVGVIKDFVIRSPYETINPMVIEGAKGWFNAVHVRFNNTATTVSNLASAEAILKKYNPEYPAEYHFVDTEYAKKFNDEQKIEKLASLFAVLTIIISCLGLFGLASYMAESRIKEIGVRKILGASVTSIASLLSREFLKLVLISFIIAAPLSWYLMDQWLADYSYRTPLSWWIFAMAGLLAVSIALVTVSFQAIKAAVANPVKSLRTE